MFQEKTFCRIAAALLLAAYAQPILDAGDASADESVNAHGRRVYHATRIEGSKPRIDGKLDDPCWKLGTWSGNFVQRQPNEDAAATEPTELKILYDDANVYVAIRAFDSQIDGLEFIRGRRDEFTGDIVGVTFDSYFDQRTAVQFNVTAGGSKIDGFMSEDGFDRSWNAVWDVRVAKEENAWTAEFRIPLSQLRYSRQDEQVWGLHVWRRLRRNAEETNWQLIPMDNSGFVYSFGELHGVEDLRPSRQIEVVPYVLGQYENEADDPGNPFVSGSNSEFQTGLDGRIRISSDFTLSLTINPDFGQVEADPSEINLTTFETFFSERRPFFLEGRDVFEFELDDDLLFYSRRIGSKPSLEPDVDGFVESPDVTRILGAGKLTGKTKNGLSVGMLYAMTDKTTAGISDDDGERVQIVEPTTQYAVARLQQEYNQGGTVIGGMASATLKNIDNPELESLTDSAYSAGLDFLHRWDDRSYFVDMKLIASQVQGSTESITELMENSVHNFQRPDAGHIEVDPSATMLNGWGGSFSIGREANSRWRYSADAEWRSPGLELNDIGFLSVADYVNPSAELEYVVTDPGKYLRRWDVSVRPWTRYNFDGERIVSGLRTRGRMTTNNNWFFFGSLVGRTETLSTRVLRGGPALITPARASGSVFFRTDSTKNLQFEFDLDHRVAFDGGSQETRIAPELSMRLLEIVNAEASVFYESNLQDFQYVDSPENDSINRYVMGRMDQTTVGSTIRLDINFTTNLTLSYYGNLFASSGSFSDFKQITNPRANRYEDRFRPLGSSAVFDPVENFYNTSDTDGPYAFENPDFDLRTFQSNLVLSWEYSPGSTVHVVWAQNRINDDEISGFSVWDDYRRIFNAHPDNRILIKVSYWLSI